MNKRNAKTGQFTAVKLKTKGVIGPKKMVRKKNPLVLPTPQGIALHLVGSKLLKRNPGYTHHGADEDLFGGPSRRLPKSASEVSRPRVKVRGGTVTFAEGSPFKGKVRKANPARGAGAKIAVGVKPLEVVMTAAEAAEIHTGAVPASMVRKALAAAKKSGAKGWDHLVVKRPGGSVAFIAFP